MKAKGFLAAFDGDCAVCDARIYEGDEVSWVDDEVAHAECAEDEGVEVYW